MEGKDISNIDIELLISIFISVDDFVKDFYAWRKTHLSDSLTDSETLSAYHQPSLSASENLTLCIYYHHSGYKSMF